MRKQNAIVESVKRTVTKHVWLAFFLVIAIACSIVFGLLPPLVLERIVDALTQRQELSFSIILLYFVLLSLSGFLDAGKESLITIFGQNVTHQIRFMMCEKLKRLPAQYYAEQDTGTTVSRFVSDVDTIETLFTSGIISMVVDACRILSILFIIFTKSIGLGILLLLVLPLLYALTRHFQKQMLQAQMDNRQAVGMANQHIPDTIRSIRMIHNLKKESYMEERYDSYIQDGFKAMDRSNFYDAIYSPIILTISALLVAIMMILSARGGRMMTLFGMSVGTAVAIISYVGKIFDPLESIGMEIQNIQSAAAGVKRINAFLQEPEQESYALPYTTPQQDNAILLSDVHFGYRRDKEILHNLNLAIREGEHVTLIGRTGAGKSTVFKLLMGLYEPWSGEVKVFGSNANEITEDKRRKMFGYVEQTFHAVPGSVWDQIALGDSTITKDEAEDALRMVGLYETVQDFPKGIDTPFQESLFSQGQIQLLSIARAIVSNPKILLLDEITANMDSETENRVLEALKAASQNRTMLSISHRMYEYSGGRCITIQETNS